MDTAFFLLAKLTALLLLAETWLVLCLFLALIALGRGPARAAQRMNGRFWIVATAVLILSIGALPLGDLVLRPLEARFPAMPPIDDPSAIIILGGAEEARMSALRGLPSLNAAGDRFVAGSVLARAHPKAKVIFSGGRAAVFGKAWSGAAVAEALFRDAGISADRVHLEGASRNTAENAALTAELLARDPGPLVLVTSAFHMPRAVGAFCAQGFKDIIPYPVDFRGESRIALRWDLSGGLERLNLGLKEWVGLLAYKVTGRVESVLPKGC